MRSHREADEMWIRRCFDLARRGIGYVSPNPPVGAVIVHNGRILAEGYHTGFGKPHAEVEAIRAVSESDRHLIPEATLYVSLEPCCITGKTPPCTDLIMHEGIRDVRISALDPNPGVAGKSIAILHKHDIRTTVGILEKEGMTLIRSFTTNMRSKRPHVVLKWAQSRFGFIGMTGRQEWLSHADTRIFAHQLRHACDVVIVGARTVTIDDPLLTTRHYPGKSPHRCVYDPEGRLSGNYNVFNADGCDVYYFSKNENPLITAAHISTFQLTGDNGHTHQMLSTLFAHQAGNVLVEGGAFTHELFIKEKLWDEAWVIQAQHGLIEGIKAPVVRGRLLSKFQSGSDTIVGIQHADDAS